MIDDGGLLDFARDGEAQQWKDALVEKYCVHVRVFTGILRTDLLVLFLVCSGFIIK